MVYVAGTLKTPNKTRQVCPYNIQTMKWFWYAHLGMSLLIQQNYGMNTTHRLRLRYNVHHKDSKFSRDQVKEMFNHGFSNYMIHAFPEDELNPIFCKGRSRESDSDKNNWYV